MNISVVLYSKDVKRVAVIIYVNAHELLSLRLIYSDLALPFDLISNFSYCLR